LVGTPVLADWAAGPLPKPCSVEVTVKLESSFTVAYVPSVFCMWTSYAEPPESVSARMIVAPDSAAVAAVVALCRSAPVKRVSSGPCVRVAGSLGALVDALLDDTVLELDDVPEEAADAIPADPSPAPAMTAPLIIR
jgi:hypothetical protein